MLNFKQLGVLVLALSFLLELSGEVKINAKQEEIGEIEGGSQLSGTKNKEIYASENDEAPHTCTTQYISSSFSYEIKSGTQIFRNKRAPSHLEKFCSGFGSQPCTCNHPDHYNVTHFELGNDMVTHSILYSEKAPTNCEDIKELGHSLNGYYLVQLNRRRVHSVYCELNSRATPIKYTIETNIKQSSIRLIKPPKFCAGVANQCNFFYSDHPDAPQYELRSNENSNSLSSENSKGPTSCEDLKFMGYNLNGFYMVRFNVKRMKAVFCDFNKMSEINKNDKVKSKREVVKSKSNTSPRKVLPFCYGVGSQPCSCYLNNEPTIPQFELGTDEITRNAASKTGIGPANCEDLKNLGHNLNGFYLVRLDSKSVRIVYCDHNPRISLQQKSSTKKPSTKLTIKPRKDSTTKKTGKSTVERESNGRSRSRKQTTTKKTRKQTVTALKVPMPSSKEIQTTIETPTSLETTPKNDNCKCKRAARLFPIRRKDDEERTTKATCQCTDLKNTDTTTKYSSTASTKIPIQKSSRLSTTSPRTRTTVAKQTKRTRHTTKKTATDKNSSTKQLTSKSSSTTTTTKLATKKIATTLQETIPTNKATKSTKRKSAITTTIQRSPLINDEKKGANTGELKAITNQKIKGTTILTQTQIKHSSTVATKTALGKSGEDTEKNKTISGKYGSIAGNLPTGQLNNAESNFNPFRVASFKKPNESKFQNNPTGAVFLLKNKHGKCVSVSTANKYLEDAQLIQSRCNPSEKAQTWKWMENRLCNGLNKCISISRDLNPGTFNVPVIQKKYLLYCEHQKWVFKSDSSQLINGLRACLAVQKDSVDDGAELKTSVCNMQEKGQSWYFDPIPTSNSDGNSHLLMDNKNNGIQDAKPYERNNYPSSGIQINDLELHDQISKQGNKEEDSPSITTVKPKVTANIKGFFQIKNEHGKCLAVKSDGKNPGQENAQVIQANCDPSKKGQNWKWGKYGRLQLLCNGWNKCLFNSIAGEEASKITQLSPIPCTRQHWYHSSNPGLIANFKVCLAVEKNSDKHGSAIITTNCNPRDKGQIWNFSSS